MKAVANLIRSKRNKKLGNYRLKIQENGNRHYIYFWTTICIEFPSTRTFIIDDSYGTRSTDRACDAYRRQFIEQGYTEIGRCPACNEELDTDSAMNSVSRQDNKTEICSDCGIQESIMELIK